MKRTYIVVLALIFIGTLCYSEELYENVLVNISINNELREELYPIYVGSDIYIELKDLEEILELEAFRDIKNKGLIYEKKRIKLKYIDYKEKEIVPISELGKLPLDKYEWDQSSLVIYIKTKYKLMDEYLHYKKEERKKLDIKQKNNNQIEVIKDQWDLITPGFLYISYLKSEGYKNIGANYTNNLLYGKFNIDYTYSNEESGVNSFYWTREILNNRVLQIGDTYIRNTFQIGDSNSIDGVSLRKKGTWEGSYYSNENQVEGIAPTGSIVELYRNNVLQEYQVVKGGRYSFEVETLKGSNYYEIWIYNLDGSISKESLTFYKDEISLNTGDWDYEIQTGKTDSSDYSENSYGYNIYYGLTDETTLNIGGFSAYKVLDRTGKNIGVLERDFIKLRLGHKYTPENKKVSYITSLEYAQDINKDENMYQGSIDGISNSYSWRGSYSNFSNLDLRLLDGGYDEEYSFYISKNLFGVGARVSYLNERSTKLDIGEKKYSFSLYDTVLKGKLSLSLTGNYEERDVYSYTSIQDYYSISVSYKPEIKIIEKFIDRVSLSLSTRDSDRYRMELAKNPWGSYYSYSIAGEKKDEEYLYSLNFSLKLGDIMELRTFTTRELGSTKTTYEGITSINIASNKKVFSRNQGEESSNIKGIIYLDNNLNSIMDKGEKGLGNFVIKALGMKAKSSENGSYYLPWMNSRQDVILEIHSENINNNYYIKQKYIVNTKPGGEMKFNIPVIPMGQLWGELKFPKNLSLEEVYGVLKESKLKVSHKDIEWSKEIVLTDEYFLLNLPIGEYDLEYIGGKGSEIKPIIKSFTIDGGNKNYETFMQLALEPREEENFSNSIENKIDIDLEKFLIDLEESFYLEKRLEVLNKIDPLALINEIKAEQQAFILNNKGGSY